MRKTEAFVRLVSKNYLFCNKITSLIRLIRLGKVTMRYRTGIPRIIDQTEHVLERESINFVSHSR